MSGSTPLTGSGFTFGGLRSRSNNISIDGLDNNDEYTGSSRTELSPEIVLEFQWLDVIRYDAESLHGQFGVRFRLVESFNELHRTPFGTTQQFLFCYCKVG